jgi:asparagine synthase (glutamine-hydrolysing)
MCGICGKLAIGPVARVDRREIAAMCAALHHRGPDDQGVHVEERIGLGAVRLSIIDVAGGHQPLSNEDGTVWAVQNGEIYNYRALRDELADRGHRFATHSDTEVLVHLYEEHGDAFVDRLRGMFALAIWDARAGRLLLARDRLGIKPLFYAEHDGALWFGSEIKALLAAGLPRRLDPVALHDYLSYDFVPGPNTMFDGITKLQAGHRLVWDGALRVERYWDLPPQPEADGVEGNVDALAAQLRTRLEDAVAAAMESDVPVGAFLSGGLDSSIVVALMARLTDRPVQTFAVGFQEKSYNELPWARRVAEHCGTLHHEEVIEPQVEDIIHSLVGAFDEPFGDSSAVAAWVVAQSAAGRTKVVLSGDGGDEVFGGYVIYQADRLAEIYRRLPPVLGEKAIPSLVRRIPVSDDKMSWDLKLRRFVEHARRDPLGAHGSWRTIFTEDMKTRLYNPRFPAARHDTLDLPRAHFDSYPGSDMLNRFIAVDTRISLVDDMLTKVDRTSMAHSLEVRVPLLDHHLVAWMSRIPSRYKVHGPRMTLKYLLKRAAAGLLPDEVIHRPKAGFHVPVPAWIKHELAPLVAQQLGRETTLRQGVFDADYVSELVAANQAEKANYSRNIWGLLMFSLWYERQIERR